MALVVESAELVWTGRRELERGGLACEGGFAARVIQAGSRAAVDSGGDDQGADRLGGDDELSGDERLDRLGQSDLHDNQSHPLERLDASGCVVVPGLVNAHHHLLQSAFRTAPHTRHVPMREWLGAMGELYSRAQVDPQLVAAAAAVGIAEGLLCGVTTVADHHLTWPSGADAEEIADAAIATASDLGCRFVFVRGCSGGDPDEVAQSVEDLAACYGNADPMLQIAVGPAGVHSDGKEMFEALAEVAAKHNLRRRTQANEQIDVEIAQERYGRRPLELMEEWGWLAEDVTIAHLCDITADERSRLARSGATATHAPGCDLPMGWGLAEVGLLLDEGIQVGLGTSGGGSNDAGHLLADARLAMQASGLAARPLTAREVLTMATAGSATGLGRSELGHLEPGAAADFCCYDISDVYDAGVADPLAGLLWSNPGRKPRHVVVNGKVVVRDGELVAIDSRHLAQKLKAEIQQRGI